MTTLGLILAFEPAEDDIMRRPPREPQEPLLSGFLVWRVVFVSALFTMGAFTMFARAEARGLPLDAARTVVVNTLVVLEIAYLFSVRFQRGSSLTWRGVLGTRPVLIGVGLVVALQLAFTYAPPLQLLFGTVALDPVADGLPILGAELVLLAVLEAEKYVRRRFMGRRD